MKNHQSTSLQVIQWFVFLLANSIALPIVIGHVFGLSGEDISSLMQRTFFIVGISSFIQGKFGHGYPIADGPAGSWVSVFVILADISFSQGGTGSETLQILEGGMMIAGVLLLLLGLSGMVQRLLFLFTPLVTGTFLLILAIQLSGVFIEGMIGKSIAKPPISYEVPLISFSVFLLVVLLSTGGRGWLKSYAVLIGIGAGWLLSLILVGRESGVYSSRGAFIKTPEIFAWGLPEWNVGMVITALLFTLILISNTIAAIHAMDDSLPSKSFAPTKLNRGSWAGGISHILSSSFSTIGVVPLPVTAGFVQMTKQYRIVPFLIACGLLSFISFFPVIVQLLAELPVYVASAALLATLIQMIGISMNNITKEPLNQRRITILGVALLMGIGLMSLPDGTINGLPVLLQYILGNGLLVGTMIAIIFEQVWKS
ncbi:purine/pyrimidine permease [Peribacillus alkalitolerans]|uniref:purine/pyrimidine permease n=1 Tax=Peribacillus alkalitolerans TaxID=1550385 RepID=UPI0013D21471|nr:purine/pyrimidine permease [Peribacillus alkalitolerans]